MKSAVPSAIAIALLFSVTSCGGGGESSSGGASTQPSGITTPSQVNVVNAN